MTNRYLAALSLACVLSRPAFADGMHIPESPICVSEADATVQVAAYMKNASRRVSRRYRR